MILSFAAGVAAREHRTLIAGDGGGQHLALSNSGATSPNIWPRCSVHSPTAKMSGSRRLHVVVDDDAAIDFETGLAAEVGVRPDAGGDHHQVGFDLLAVSETQTLDLAVAERAPRSARPSSTRMPRFSILRFRYIAAGRVELTLHQRVDQWTTVTSQPCTCRPRAASRPSSPPPITTALQPGRDRSQQRARVVQRAEHEDVLLVDARDRRDEGAAAGGEDQLVVRGRRCRRRR